MSMATAAQPESGPVADRIAGNLVRAGLVREEDRAEASRVVADGLRGARVVLPPPVEHAPLRRRIAEIAGYVGAALVLGAVGLFFAQQWSSLSHGARVAILAVAAVALAAGGLGLLARLPGPRREALRSVQGRLAAVLLGAAAVSAAFAAAVAVGPGQGDGARAFVVFAVTLLLAGLLGYLAVPSSVGQVVVAVGAVVLVPSSLELAGVSSALVTGLVLVAVGVGLLLLAELGVWRPLMTAEVIGCVIAFAGAQVPVAGSPHPWVGYVATALLAAGAFATYVVRRAWPYLVLGVVATTVAVPEALTDWTGGSLGAAGALLVAGVALLGASLAGLRLRKEVTEKQPRRHRVP
ncbi:MAG TPA: hypothetical protein VFJ09_14450 [Nocardioidaceae bacterium]|nr:hypothetical protein [Nocardioidaceae bacterium]